MLRNKGTKIFSEIADFFTSGEKAILKIIDLHRKMGISSFHIGVKDDTQGTYRKMDILLSQSRYYPAQAARPNPFAQG